MTMHLADLYKERHDFKMFWVIIAAIFWGGCLLTIAWEVFQYLATGSWNAITLHDAIYPWFGEDIIMTVGSESVIWLFKVLYVLRDTRLDVFLWWAGVAVVLLGFCWNMIRKS